jgi:hypothetical protein
LNSFCVLSSSERHHYIIGFVFLIIYYPSLYGSNGGLTVTRCHIFRLSNAKKRGVTGLNFSNRRSRAWMGGSVSRHLNQTLWCRTFSHHYICTMKIALPNFVQFLIPLTERLLLMRGLNPSDRFFLMSILGEKLFCEVKLARLCNTCLMW